MNNEISWKNQILRSSYNSTINIVDLIYPEIHIDYNFDDYELNEDQIKDNSIIMTTETFTYIRKQFDNKYYLISLRSRHKSILKKNDYVKHEQKRQNIINNFSKLAYRALFLTKLDTKFINTNLEVGTFFIEDEYQKSEEDRLRLIYEL